MLTKRKSNKVNESISESDDHDSANKSTELPKIHDDHENSDADEDEELFGKNYKEEKVMFGISLII